MDENVSLLVLLVIRVRNPLPHRLFTFKRRFVTRSWLPVDSDIGAEAVEIVSDVGDILFSPFTTSRDVHSGDHRNDGLQTRRHNIH